LAVEELMPFPDVCPIDLKLIQWDARTHHHPRAPSLDRIDPRKGYVKGNVRIVSWEMNRKRSNLSMDDLLLLLDDAFSIQSRAVWAAYPDMELKLRRLVTGER
jgi:hypothetical protein